MKPLSLTIAALFLFGCNNNGKQTEITTKKDTAITAENTATLSASIDTAKTKKEIRDLIRKVLNWGASKNSIDLLPAIADNKDSSYVGFDLEKHKANLIKLKAVGSFASGFIDNYDQIILTLDKKFKAHEFPKWSTGELPPFNFASDADPWCLCQDVPYDTPNPWDLVEIHIIRLDNDKGELNWTWGKPELNGAPGWKEFTYKFGVIKEDGSWKIAYLQGFDLKDSTK